MSGFQDGTIRAWRNVLLKHFSCKQIKNRVLNICVKITSVDQKVKCGYLWDLFEIQPEELKLLLDDLRKEKLLSSDLTVLTLGDNKFVIQLKHAETNLLKYNQSNDLFLIDVSKHLKFPEFLNLSNQSSVLTESFDSLYNQIKNASSSDILRIELPPSNKLNLCTLYGMLLGYPLIYWFTEQDHQSLFASDLIVQSSYVNVHMEGGFDDNENKSVTRFSYPKLLKVDVENIISSWKLNERNKSLLFGSTPLNFIVKSIEYSSNSSVAL